MSNKVKVKVNDLIMKFPWKITNSPSHTELLHQEARDKHCAFSCSVPWVDTEIFMRWGGVYWKQVIIANPLRQKNPIEYERAWKIFPPSFFQLNFRKEGIHYEVASFIF